MRNKILSFAIVLSMLFSIMVMPVGAEVLDSGECGVGLVWTMNSNGTLSITYSGSGMGNMRSYHAQAIDEEGEPYFTTAPWYSYRESITLVLIDYGVMSIGNYAFDGLVNLTDIYYDGTEEEWAEVQIGSGNELMTLANMHFAVEPSNPHDPTPNPITGGGSGTSTVIGTDENTVTAEFWAYAEAEESDLDIRRLSCRYILVNDKNDADHVGDIYVDVYCENSSDDFNFHFPVSKEGQGEWYTWKAENGGYPDVYVHVPYTEGYYAYYLKDEQTAEIVDADEDQVSGKITIPSTLGGHPVKYIGEYAMEYCPLLTGVTIPNGVIHIGEGAFYKCKNLTYIAISDSVEFIGEDAFSDTAYYNNEDNWGEDDILYIGKCLIKSFADPYGEVTLRDDTRLIADGSRLWRCDGINVPEANPFLSSKDGILYNKDKTTLILCPCYQKSFISEDGKRKVIFIPEGVKRIETGAFSEGWREFRGIILPRSLKSIGAYAFGEDCDISFVCYGGSSEDWEKIDIGEGNEIYPGFFGSTEWCIGFIDSYEDEDEEIYAIVEFVDKTASAVTIPSEHEGVEIAAIAWGAFNYCDKLTSVTIPHSITEIGPYAFASCKDLADVYYDGTEEDWANIKIYDENDNLINANIHFKRKTVQPIDIEDIEGDNAVLDMTADEDVSGVDVPVTYIQNLVDAEKGIEAKVIDENGKNINIVFDKDALSAIAEGATGNITIKVENPVASDLNDAQQVQTTALASKNPTVYSFNIENGNTDFGTGRATVKVYYDKTGTGDVQAVYLKEDGTTEVVPAVYDDGTKTVKLTLSHFSDYVIYTEPQRRLGGGGGIQSYTVKLDTNGGDELKNLSIKKGQAIGTIPTPAKKGYVFDGWYSDKELTKEYSLDEKVTESTTLFAAWKVDPIRQMTLTIGDKNATVFGAETTNDVAPIIRNDRTMLPIRFIAEALGAEVSWDSETKVVTIIKDDIEIKITIDQGVAIVNGEEITLDSPAFIESDRTFLPLRFVSENLGAEVDWVEDARQVVITKPIED